MVLAGSTTPNNQCSSHSGQTQSDKSEGYEKQ